jgi:hypothetical protein
MTTWKWESGFAKMQRPYVTLMDVDTGHFVIEMVPTDGIDQDAMPLIEAAPKMRALLAAILETSGDGIWSKQIQRLLDDTKRPT